MKRLEPKEAFSIIGCRYDHGMRMVRDGQFDGCFYRIGRRVFFLQEKLEDWIERQVIESSSQKNVVPYSKPHRIII